MRVLIFWGCSGVGWDVNVHFDFNYITRSLALPHICHAMLLCVLLHLHAYVMLPCWTFSCTSTHTSCYSAGRSLALPHIRHAMLLDALLHFHTYVMLRCRSLALPHKRHMCKFLVLKDKWLHWITGNVLHKLEQLGAWIKKRNFSAEHLVYRIAVSLR